jgi:hypothetical protein
MNSFLGLGGVNEVEERSAVLRAYPVPGLAHALLALTETGIELWKIGTHRLHEVRHQ